MKILHFIKRYRLSWAFLIIFSFAAYANFEDEQKLSVLDRFMEKSFETQEIRIPSVVSEDSLAENLNDISIEEKVEANTTDPIGALSQRALLEDENRHNATLDSESNTNAASFLKSNIIDSYKYVKIGDNSRFLKALSKSIMQSDDNNVKAEAYYWEGLIHLKNGKSKKAGQSFLEGYKQGRDGLFGVYNLFELAHSMHLLEKHEESCTAIKQLIQIISEENEDKIYPSLFKDRAIDSQGKFCKIS